ncbi:hypothetical protein EJ05DRAFT_508010 [Pseudovirgaria hyperparasitica]|uniref:Uncharacterized protein n=1 Tax=Pseudovirgaria hyperparasitica TaxID=470096 RepID=A0A6A6WGJ4_9PEZI|nr:uncharacterized protein EJ05DRAFT_508010 [Pseudovirgaria hyperparasitica]KAF2760757.1 hypothetical protein EJ05DRAFT_508010 [Pseudovirgaria hyperparasitica]
MHFSKTLITIVAATTSLVIADRRRPFPETDPDMIRETITLPVIKEIKTLLEDPERKSPVQWRKIYYQAGYYNVWDQIWAEVIHGFDRIKLPTYLETIKPTCTDEKLAQEDYEKALAGAFTEVINTTNGELSFDRFMKSDNGSVMAYGCNSGYRQTVHLSDLIAIHAAIKESCGDKAGSFDIGKWRVKYGVSEAKWYPC